MFKYIVILFALLCIGCGQVSNEILNADEPTKDESKQEETTDSVTLAYDEVNIISVGTNGVTDIGYQDLGHVITVPIPDTIEKVSGNLTNEVILKLKTDDMIAYYAWGADSYYLYSYIKADQTIKSTTTQTFKLEIIWPIPNMTGTLSVRCYIMWVGTKED